MYSMEEKRKSVFVCIMCVCACACMHAGGHVCVCVCVHVDERENYCLLICLQVSESGSVSLLFNSLSSYNCIPLVELIHLSKPPPVCWNTVKRPVNGEQHLWELWKRIPEKRQRVFSSSTFCSLYVLGYSLVTPVANVYIQFISHVYSCWISEPSWRSQSGPCTLNLDLAFCLVLCFPR